MNNFLDFIKRDIACKETMITSMPNKTKTNKKKINDTIKTMEEKYKDYKDNVKNYLIVKSHSFEIKEDTKEYDKLKEEIIALEQIKFLLNPTNSYIEKLGFDELLFQINNFNKFNFHSLNDILNAFLDKFDLVGVHLTANDFNYTVYVNEYMTAFLDVRYGKEKTYDKVSKIFERIYWSNPDLINHLGLNFKKLIRHNAKKFENNISKIQKKSMKEYSIDNYEECCNKLKDKYIKLQDLEKESIGKIISLALDGSFDINHYKEDSKVRTNAFLSLLPNDLDTSDKKEMDKVCEILYKLKFNVEEYQNYLKFEELFKYFKTNYKSLIDNKTSKTKELLNDIEKSEKDLDKYNKVLFGSEGFVHTIYSVFNKDAESKANQLIRKLTDLYKEYDEESYKDKVRDLVTVDTTLESVLHLYYSFDYLKKSDIQKSYETNDYNEIVDLSSDFDLYSMNHNNLIVKGVNIFDDTNIAAIIANKYKLNNLKIDESDLAEENLVAFYNKIKLILRVNTINNSESSIEKIWFMVQTKKLLSLETEEK